MGAEYLIGKGQTEAGLVRQLETTYRYEPTRVVTPTKDGGWQRNYWALGGNAMAGLMKQLLHTNELPGSIQHELIDTNDWRRLRLSSSTSRTLPDFLEERFSRLTSEEAKRAIKDTLLSTIQWVDEWVLSDDTLGEIDRRKPHYRQAYAHAKERYHSDYSDEMIDWWNSLHLSRFLIAKDSVPKEMIVNELGWHPNSLIPEWLRQIPEEQLTNNVVLNKVRALSHEADVDMALFPPKAFEYVFGEMESLGLLEEKLRKYGAYPIESGSKAVFEKMKVGLSAIPVGEKDIRLPPGFELVSKHLQFRYVHGQIFARNSIPYTAIRFYVDIRQKGSDEVVPFNVFSTEFTPAPTNEELVDQDTHVGWKASLHDRFSMACLVNPRKLFQPTLAGRSKWRSRTPGNLVLTTDSGTGEALIGYNSPGPYIEGMRNGDSYDSSDVIACWGRMLKNGLFSCITIPKNNYLPVTEESYYVFRDLMKFFKSDEVNPFVKDEVQNNLIRSWFLDFPETAAWLEYTHALEAFPRLAAMPLSKIATIMRGNWQYNSIFNQARRAIALKEAGDPREMSELVQSFWQLPIKIMRVNHYLPEELVDKSDFEIVVALTQMA